jgi:hypothetical protein
MFGILLLDLKTGREKVIDQDRYIWNPHPQFDPSGSYQAVIQHNRGENFDPNDTAPYTGPKDATGVTLYLLSVPDGKRTELQVGRPYTTPVQGHHAWSRHTREVITTVHGGPGFDWRTQGNLLAVRAGNPARVVAKGYSFGHVGVSRCGRFFCCEDWANANRVVIGSVETGRTAVVCESKTSGGGDQNTHAHAYLTPDLKWVIFNSDRSGLPHVHATSVPAGLIDQLQKA